MSLPKIENLELRKVTEDILLAHQKRTPYYFSCCDGLIILPKHGRNTKTIILDLNIEPNLANQIDKQYGSISDYVCTHAHMDHMAHVHQWEILGAVIHAPAPEHTYLLDLHNFYEGFGFNKAMDFSAVRKFGELNGYHKCTNVNPIKLGDILQFENLIVETIPFQGHSKAHVGLLLPHERIIHISCLGFDQKKPRDDGFGPWYGFEECSIEQYLKDIDHCESIFLEKCDFLTSSHSYIVKNPDPTPFVYMREKIAKNQSTVDHAIISLKQSTKSDINIQDLLELDLFFPKRKMEGFLQQIYNFWETGIISKHVERSKYLV
jgi:glyoxylase-like metal-dependent hydrolase (beta-lactamase superfamily II)